MDVRSEMAASVFRIEVSVGQDVAAGDVVAVLESMKMEIPVLATTSGRIEEVLVSEGELIDEGSIVVRVGS